MLTMKSPTKSLLLVHFPYSGDTGVGKTNLLSQYSRGEFSLGTTTTVGIEFSNKIKIIDKQKVRVQIWDTAGQERFSKVSAAFYRSAVGAFLVYDITKKETFNDIPKWMSELENFSDPNILTMLVGNKKDLEESSREVTIEEASAFAHSHGIANFETSARTGENVNEAFDALITEIYKLIKLKPEFNIGPPTSFQLPKKLAKKDLANEKSCSC